MSSQQTDRPRAVFLDIDGTYADHGLAPAAHVEAVQEVRRRGHLVFVCTGRPLSMVPAHILEAGFDGVITGAGARVEMNGEVLKDTRFEPGRGGRSSWTPWTPTTSPTSWRLPKPCAAAPEWTSGCGSVLSPVFANGTFAGTTASSVPTWIPLEDILGPVQYGDDLRAASFAKISCFDSPVPLTAPHGWPRPAGGAHPQFPLRPRRSAGEIFMAGVHKAVGIQVVEAHLGLDREDIVAIGDSANDIEMLAYAGVGIAVEGGHPDVLAVADRFTPGPPATVWRSPSPNWACWTDLRAYPAKGHARRAAQAGRRLLPHGFGAPVRAAGEALSAITPS